MVSPGNHAVRERAAVARPPTLTVVIADDRPVVRAGLRLITEPVAAVASDVDLPGLPDAVATHHPDVALVGIRTGTTDPFASIAAATSRREDLRVVVLADEATMVDLREAVTAGVHSFLLTASAGADDIVEAVRVTARGDRVVASSIAMRLATTWHREPDHGSPTLTRRELEVLDLLTEGLTNKQIGERLDLSPRTIKTHVQNLLRKLDVPDRTAAVATALRDELIR